MMIASAFVAAAVAASAVSAAPAELQRRGVSHYPFSLTTLLASQADIRLAIR